MLRIARRCQQADAEVRVYTMHWDGPRPEGFDVRIVPTRGWTNHTRAKHFADQVHNLLKADPVNTVVGHNRIPGVDLYFGSDVCYAEEIRYKHPLYRLTPRCRTYLSLEKAVVGSGSKTHLLLISPRQVSDYKKHYRLPDERFTLLPPGLDEAFKLNEPTADARRRIRDPFGIDQDDFMLLHVGSAFKRKGLDRAVRALGSVPRPLLGRTHLVVAGQGNVSFYRRLAGRLQVDRNLHFAGVRDDIAALMAAADILVHPARVENTGLTLLEALASDLPVLCTAACGYASYVSDASGGIVLDEPFDQSQMNTSLSAMLSADMLKQYRLAIETYRKRTSLGGLDQRAAAVIMEHAQ